MPPARLTLVPGLPSRALEGEAAPLLGLGGDELSLRGLERGADVLAERMGLEARLARMLELLARPGG